MSKQTKIVIIGGGFAGINVAATLERMNRRSSELDITLIDGENFFTFTPLLPEVPSGSIQPKHIVFPLRALLKHTHVRQAHVKSIDLEQQVVTAAHCGKCGEDRVPFDHLVLALGSVPNFYGTPGVAENALTMKTLADAVSLHAHLIDRLEHADLQHDPEKRKALLTCIVAGGGFAGVETIAEVNDFLREARRFYPRVAAQDLRVVLVHSGSRILPEVSESLSAYALRKLRQRGVDVLLESRVLSCNSERVELSDGQQLPAGTFVWAAGTAPSPIAQMVNLPRTKSGRIDVEPTMLIKGLRNVWAVGDSAAIPDLVTGGVCPPTAQFALRQGKQLAKNILATIEGRPLDAFRFKALGLLAGLGRRCAVAEVLGWKFSGFLAWWLWRTVYLLKLPGFERKLRVAIDWTFDLCFPRDIVFLRPLHSVRGEGTLNEQVAHDASCKLPIHPAHPIQVAKQRGEPNRPVHEPLVRH